MYSILFKLRSSKPALMFSVLGGAYRDCISSVQETQAEVLGLQ